MALSWMRAVALAALAVYGPFVVMAIHASLFVSCAHCKAAAWTVLPCGPALLPLQVGWNLGLARPAGSSGFVLAFVASGVLIQGLAWLLRRGRRARIAGIVVAASLSAVLAAGTLAMIRA